MQTFVSNTVSRRIEFAELYYLDSLGREVTLNFTDLQPLLTIMGSNVSLFEEDNSISYKWYGLDSVVVTPTFAKIIAKNCIYNYRPNYVDVVTKSEKISPKQASEGEKQTTHFLYKGTTLVYEKRRGGTTLLRLIAYINQAISAFPGIINTNINRIRVRVILFDNYIEIFNNSKRIKNITITKDISTTNNDYENFHTDGMKETFQETFTARRGSGLAKGWIRNAIDRLYRGSNEILKVTMDAVDENDEDITINTEKMTKHIIRDFNVDTQGVIISEHMFSILVDL